MLRALLDSKDVTEVCTLRGRVGLMAFHGGNLERATDVVAREVARRTDSSYYAVLQAAPFRKHLPSTAFRVEDSAALTRFFERVDVAITIHGYARRASRADVLLGGRNRRLAAHLAAYLRAGLPHPYRVVSDLERVPCELRGQDPRNPVNVPPDSGVQIELPPTIRWNQQERNWSDHEGTGRAPQVDLLIAALAAGVDAWTDAPREHRARAAPRIV